MQRLVQGVLAGVLGVTTACATTTPMRGPGQRAQTVREAAVMAETARVWRARGMAWRDGCADVLRRVEVVVVLDVADMPPGCKVWSTKQQVVVPAFSCTSYRHNIPVMYLRPEYYEPGMLVHEGWHLLHRSCARELMGDPNHVGPDWSHRDPQGPEAEAKANARAQGPL